MEEPQSACAAIAYSSVQIGWVLNWEQLTRGKAENYDVAFSLLSKVCLRSIPQLYPRYEPSFLTTR